MASTLKLTPPCRVLVIDDQRSRLDSLYTSGVLDGVVATYAADALTAMDYLERYQFDVVFLDHDLETFVTEPHLQEVNGQDVAQFITELAHRPKLVVIHSVNYTGATAIEAILQRAGIKTLKQPITSLAQWSPARSGRSPRIDADLS